MRVKRGVLLVLVVLVLQGCSWVNQQLGLSGATGIPKPAGDELTRTVQSERYFVVPNSVYDGDTLRVMDARQELKIRLCGIDAPEMDQQMGIESRDYLRSLIDQGHGAILVAAVEKDRYGRTVAELYVPTDDGGEIHLNSQMVADGMAFVYDRYVTGCPNGSVIARAGEMAQSQQLGVWGTPGMVKPWEHRQQ